MNRRSLFFSLTLFYALALLGVLALFGGLMGMERHREGEEAMERYRSAVHMGLSAMRHNADEELLQEQLGHLGFHLENSEEQRAVEQEGKVLMERHPPGRRIRLLEYRGERYLLLSSRHGTMLLEDHYGDQLVPRLPILLGALLSALAFTTVLYILALRKLRPLKRLQHQIRRYGDGEGNIRTAMEGGDEIAEVANEFDRAIRKVERLEESRRLFLRNAMHELKTPLTKGRVVGEMVNDPVQKDRLSRVFARLEELIREMAATERLTSGTATIHPGTYRLVDLADEAKDRLMAEEGEIRFALEDRLLRVDFDLFATALKNLLDNGLRHGEGPVTLQSEGNTLFVLSGGSPLPRPLEDYLVPFRKDTSAEKGGLGLGLYIVHRIFALHGLTLIYRREAGINRFSVNLDPVRVLVD